jgi:hypothetical protein
VEEIFGWVEEIFGWVEEIFGWAAVKREGRNTRAMRFSRETV